MMRSLKRKQFKHAVPDTGLRHLSASLFNEEYLG